MGNVWEGTQFDVLAIGELSGSMGRLRLHEFSEGEREEFDFDVSSGEQGGYFAREQVGIAASNVNVYVVGGVI